MTQPTPAVLPGSTAVPAKPSVKESVYEDPEIPAPQTNAPESSSPEAVASPEAVDESTIPAPDDDSVLDTTPGSTDDSAALGDPESELDRVFDQNEHSSGQMMQPRRDVPQSVRVLEVPQTQTAVPAETSVQAPAETPLQAQEEVTAQNTAETLAEIEMESDSETILAPESTEADALVDSIPSVEVPESPESDSVLPLDLPQEFPEVPFGGSDSSDLEGGLNPQESAVSQPSGSQAMVLGNRRPGPLKKALSDEQKSARTNTPVLGAESEVQEHSILQDGAAMPKNPLKNIPASAIIQAAGSVHSEEAEAASEVSNAGWVVVSRQESGIRLVSAEDPAPESVLATPAEVDLNFTPAPAAVQPERPSYAQPADEYIIDSKSAGRKVELKGNRKVTVSGVEMDDNWQAETQNETGTYIYYNGLQGRATVQSPDPVYIYAPRFRAVRQLVDLNVDEQVTTTGDLYTPTHVSTANRNLETSTAKTNLQVETDSTRTVMLQANGTTGTGILDGEVAPGVETQEAVIPQENRKVVGLNAMNGKTRALGTEGLLEVHAWTRTEEMRVFIDQQSASAAIRTESTPSLYTVQEGDHKQDVRIYKVVSKTSARPGETVDFIIYFENTGNTPIGNITLVDNLPARLEIVEDSAESSVDSSFTYEINGNGSQTLRWEVTQPLAAGEKGAVKFKALVR